MAKLCQPRCFTVPKKGNAQAENEDRAICRIRRNTLVALSDGATEGALSGRWAEALVASRWKFELLSEWTGGSDRIPDDVVEGWLAPLRADFESSHQSDQRPWYAKEKLKRGAFATFLAFRMNSRRRWRAVACGDTCMIAVKSNHLAMSIPVKSSAEFDIHPELVSSKPDALMPALQRFSGSLDDGVEVLIFATDALAAWLLEEHDQERRLRQLLVCRDEQEFAELVEDQRAGGNLKNDDTTAVILDCAV